MIEILTIPDDRTPVDLLLYRHFRREIPGLVEAVLALNHGLAAMGHYPPVFTKVKVDRDVATRLAKSETRKVIRLYD